MRRCALSARGLPLHQIAALATRDGNLDALKRWPQYMACFEPTTLLAALSVATSRIGLV